MSFVSWKTSVKKSRTSTQSCNVYSALLSFFSSFELAWLYISEVPYKYFKTKNIELDAEKCYVKYISFEGDPFGDKVESVVYEGKLEENGVYIYKHIYSQIYQ